MDRVPTDWTLSLQNHKEFRHTLLMLLIQTMKGPESWLLETMTQHWNTKQKQLRRNEGRFLHRREAGFRSEYNAWFQSSWQYNTHSWQEGA